jgi:phosphoribosyl-AMP cyclohydrolase
MKIDFEKMGGLIPAIIQDSATSKVLMLGGSAILHHEGINVRI